MNLNWLPAFYQGLSTLGRSRDIKAEGSFEASMLRTNSRLAKMRADDALSRGASSSTKVAVDARSMIGSQKAALAAQGVDVGSGSALDVQIDTAKLAEIDIMTIRNNAAREAWGFNVEATDLENQARLREMKAKNQSRTTLLTGGLETLRLFNNR